MDTHHLGRGALPLFNLPAPCGCGEARASCSSGPRRACRLYRTLWMRRSEGTTFYEPAAIMQAISHPAGAVVRPLPEPIRQSHTPATCGCGGAAIAQAYSSIIHTRDLWLRWCGYRPSLFVKHSCPQLRCALAGVDYPIALKQRVPIVWMAIRRGYKGKLGSSC